MMRVQVKLFAVARQRAGADAVEVDVPEGACVRDLRHALVEQHPPLADVMRHARLAINNDYASDAAVVDSRSEIAMIPPVSGG